MILGIDLGTTNSLAGVFRDGSLELIPNAFGEFLTPSVVGLDDQGEIIVGNIAKERLVTHPDKTVSQFKRFMGSKHPIRLGEKSYQAEELSSFVIRKLIEDAEQYLDQTVDEVIVSVPAYFNDHQRYATKLAGQLAGVKIERIINEPSAAALAQQSHQNFTDGEFIVVDFGGGTLDISVVESFENVVEILAIAGDNRLGGEDFTKAIAHEFLRHHQLDDYQVSNDFFNKILNEAEFAKRSLNTEDQVLITVVHKEQNYEMELTYQRFYEVCQPLLARVKGVLDRAMFDAQYAQVNAKDVVLVGGTSKLRLVQEFLSFCIQETVKPTGDPDLMIAKGCALVAGIKERKGEVRDVLLSDICPFTLGTDIVGDKFSPIIERNSPLPVSRVGRYITSHLGQEEIEVTIYQGEKMRASDNLVLGKMIVPVPKNLKDYEAIDVRFTYDLNGILEIEIKVLTTGKVYTKVILQEGISLSDEEILQKRKELEKYKINPQETEVYRFLLEKANRLYGMLLGTQRQYLMEHTSQFEKEVSEATLSHLPKIYNNFADFLEKIERGNNGYF